MKRMSYIRAAFVSVVLIATVQAYSQQSSGDRREISTDYHSQIERLNEQMAQDMIQGNIEQTIRLYTPDAISLPPFEPMRQGLDAIRKNAEEMKNSGMKITSFEPKITKLITEGNLITEIGTYKITLTTPGSDQNMEDHGKYITIWEKQPDGSLRIKVETWNSDVNPMETMQSGQGMGKPGQSDHDMSWPERSDSSKSQSVQPSQPVTPGQTPSIP